MGFFRPTSGITSHSSDVGFICLTSHPPYCFPWLSESGSFWFFLVNPFLDHLKTVLTKIFFSLHITDSSVNFTWLVFRQIIDEINLFAHGTHCSICQRFEKHQNKYFSRLEYLCLIELQTMQNLHLWQTFLE